jgi:uncharacterized protein
MAASFYDLSIGSYLQTVDAVGGFLAKGLDHCQGCGADPAKMVEARLAEDMLPLRFQIVSVAHHSVGAIEGMKKGIFTPPGRTEALDYAGLQKLIADTAEGLRRLSREEVDALSGRDVVFQIGERKVPFTTDNFLLSFSLPNFYFHATTAYDLLRTNGVPLGKRDYLGRMRIKT